MYDTGLTIYRRTGEVSGPEFCTALTLGRIFTPFFGLKCGLIFLRHLISCIRSKSYCGQEGEEIETKRG